MDRRNFLAAVLPAALGATAFGTSVSAAGAAPPPRRIKVEVSQLKADPEFGDLVANTLVVVADEGVETYAAFTHFDNFHYVHYDDAGTTRTMHDAQANGPSLRVTPHVGADGRITVDVNVQFVGPIAGALPDPTSGAVPVQQEMVQNLWTVESGQAAMMHVPVSGFKPDIRLTATLLGPHQAI